MSNLPLSSYICLRCRNGAVSFASAAGRLPGWTHGVTFPYSHWGWRSLHTCWSCCGSLLPPWATTGCHSPVICQKIIRKPIITVFTPAVLLQVTSWTWPFRNSGVMKGWCWRGKRRENERWMEEKVHSWGSPSSTDKQTEIAISVYYHTT